MKPWGHLACASGGRPIASSKVRHRRKLGRVADIDAALAGRPIDRGIEDDDESGRWEAD